MPLHSRVPWQPGIGHPGLPTSSREAFLQILAYQTWTGLVLWQKTDIRDLGDLVRTSATFLAKKRVFSSFGRLVAMLEGAGVPARDIWLGLGLLKRFKTFSNVSDVHVRRF